MKSFPQAAVRTHHNHITLRHFPHGITNYTTDIFHDLPLKCVICR